uniref:Uncharacterized protein n=1 Tax=Timema monikensis TaxID=170555 RepID=A0A7R9EBW8_9NEOP|nr:unnamed protein product [Timema monikensis]
MGNPILDCHDVMAQPTLSKRKLPALIMPEPALREKQCSLYLAVPPSSPPLSYVRMHITVKHHIAGTRVLQFRSAFTRAATVFRNNNLLALTLDKIISILDDDENILEANVFMSPPENHSHCDEDTEDEDLINPDINHLSGNQLRVTTELHTKHLGETGIRMKIDLKELKLVFLAESGKVWTCLLYQNQTGNSLIGFKIVIIS